MAVLFLPLIYFVFFCAPPLQAACLTEKKKRWRGGANTASKHGIKENLPWHVISVYDLNEMSVKFSQASFLYPLTGAMQCWVFCFLFLFFLLLYNVSAFLQLLSLWTTFPSGLLRHFLCTCFNLHVFCRFTVLHSSRSLYDQQKIQPSCFYSLNQMLFDPHSWWKLVNRCASLFCLCDESY